MVVTHGGLVHFLTDDWTDNGKFAGACDPRVPGEIELRCLINEFYRDWMGKYRIPLLQIRRRGR